MNTATMNQNISTSQRIVALGLPARERVKALATLAWVEALISTLFGKGRTTHKSSAAIRPTLKAQ